MSLKALDTLAQLVLEDSPKPILKTAIQCLATVYGLVFRHLCVRDCAGRFSLTVPQMLKPQQSGTMEHTYILQNAYCGAALVPEYQRRGQALLHEVCAEGRACANAGRVRS